MTSAEQKSLTERVFLQALEVPERQRPEFLNEACRNDQELRREVESLLRHHNPSTIVVASRFKRESTGPIAAALTSLVAAVASKVLGGRTRRALAWGLTALLLGGVGYWTRARVRDALLMQVHEQLRVVLNADVVALQSWIDDWLREAGLWAENPVVRAQTERLVRIVGGDPGKARAARNLPFVAELGSLFKAFLAEAQPGETVGLLDRGGVRLAVWPDTAAAGRRNNERAAALLVPVMEGQTRFAPPARHDAYALEGPEDPRPVVFAIAPVRGSSGKVIAALVFARLEEHGYSQILSVARMGASGETYTVSPEGLMLSQSRFDGMLKKARLIPDTPGASSVVTVQVRDPGGDLTHGYKPALDLEARPLTMIMRLAVASRGKPADQQTGVILEPYRNYRGVEVVGAWRWLPKYNFAVVTEVDASEAFAVLNHVTRAFGVLIGVLAALAGSTLLASVSLAHIRRRQSSLPDLGPYRLMKQIGEGGMGQVYLARHALLRRPTAVKVLKSSDEAPGAAARFEREAQAASRLTHPNTIEIYDFGRTPDGTFYYAMEYLPGLTLAELISMEGPITPGRVIHILLQVCGSLQEAHGQGLIHRDIKPANIMLCERGGHYDFVKVLDFGLVRQVGSVPTQITVSKGVIGTPLYMAPERLSRPGEADVRSDIYSLGAVAYHLLSARPVFQSVNELDLLSQVLHAEPERPSKRVPVPIPDGLECLVMNCLAKDPAQRPHSVTTMLEVLETLQEVAPWTEQQAKEWWARCGPKGVEAAPGTGR